METLGKSGIFVDYTAICREVHQLIQTHQGIGQHLDKQKNKLTINQI